MGRKRTFSDEDLKEMIDDYQKGMSLKQLEKKFSSSKEKIKETLKYNNVILREYNKNYKYVEVGSKFNSLTFLEEINERKNKKILWLVQCDCGNKKIVYKPDVLSGKTKSCGCLKYESRLINENRKEVVSNLIYGEYKKSAKVRGYDFKLDFDLFLELISSTSCFYCGKNNTNKRKDESSDFVLHYIGIDRLINTLGYVEGNVVPCCTKCNYMKKDMDIDEFIDLINLIHKNTSNW